MIRFRVVLFRKQIVCEIQNRYIPASTSGGPHYYSLTRPALCWSKHKFVVGSFRLHCFSARRRRALNKLKIFQSIRRGYSRKNIRVRERRRFPAGIRQFVDEESSLRGRNDKFSWKFRTAKIHGGGRLSVCNESYVELILSMRSALVCSRSVNVLN